MVGVNEEVDGPEVTSEAFDVPRDATSLEVKGDPGAPVVKSGAADEHIGTEGASTLLFFRVAPRPSMVASQYRRKRREPSAMAFQ